MEKPKYGKDRNKELMDFLCEEDKSEKLKSCPFCSGKPYVYTSGNESCGFFEEIICGECGCRTKRLKEGIAKDAWNRRVDNG